MRVWLWVSLVGAALAPPAYAGSHGQPAGTRPAEHTSAWSWTIHCVRPWIAATEHELCVASLRPAAEIRLRGARNDWLTGALLLRAARPTAVRFVGVRGLGDLARRLEVRVVGMGNWRGGGFTPDPLFAAGDFNPTKPLARYLSNWDCIKDFPALTVTPEHPTMLWLTFRTHGLAAGPYRMHLIFEDSGGWRRAFPVRVYVYPPELPERSPLYYFLWQYVPGPPRGQVWATEYLARGVNVFHQQHEIAWRAGARFLLFFAPRDAFGRRLPITPERRARVVEGVRKILATVRRLGLRREQWAVYITDEPRDKDMDAVIEYGRLIREVDPNVPLYVTLPWGPGPKNLWCTPAGVRKLAATGLISVWHPYWYHAWDGSGTWEIMRRTGRPVWIYAIHANVPRKPDCGLSMYRRGPWYAFNYGVQGFGVYAGYSFNGNPWDDLDGKYDYYVNYSYGARGFITTRLFEAIRQGVQEYKLLDLLARCGADRRWLDAQVERAVTARRSETIEVIRRRLLWRLTKLMRR